MPNDITRVCLPGKLLRQVEAYNSSKLGGAPSIQAGQLRKAIAIADGLAELLWPQHNDRRKASLTSYKIRRMTEFAEANIDGKIGLTDLARVAGMSRAHLCRCFSETTGMTPMAWLRKLRIERAMAEIAANPNITLTQVALNVGFQSLTSFGAAFRNQTGSPPSVWRRSLDQLTL